MNDAQRRLAEHLITGLNLEGVTPESIDPEAPLFGSGLGLDSIDALELAVVVERTYGLRIADQAQGKEAFASLAALERFISSQGKAV
ncbi:acyl carrier protein [Planctomycetota bacterium]|nr:acyl carrier protein [Planctomycetota bacterium]